MCTQPGDFAALVWLSRMGHRVDWVAEIDATNADLCRASGLRRGWVRGFLRRMAMGGALVVSFDGDRKTPRRVAMTNPFPPKVIHNADQLRDKDADHYDARHDDNVARNDSQRGLATTTRDPQLGSLEEESESEIENDQGSDERPPLTLTGLVPDESPTPDPAPIPDWLRKAKIPPRFDRLEVGAMVVEACSAITGRLRNLNGYRNGVATDAKAHVLPLWKALEYPPPALLGVDLARIAVAARDCQERLFGHDIRAEGFEGGADRSRLVDTICRHGKFMARLHATEAHEDGRCCCAPAARRRVEQPTLDEIYAAEDAAHAARELDA